MEDTRNVAEILVGMGNGDYEAARILMSLKCLGNTNGLSHSGNGDVSVRPPSGRCVSLRVPIMMLSPWTTTAVLPVSTPYVLWHGKWGVLVCTLWFGGY
jgi:hypothetical protein